MRHFSFKAATPIDVNNTVSHVNFSGIARFTISETERITVRVCVTTGGVEVYGSFRIRNPSKALHDFALDAFTHGNITCQDVFLLSSSDFSVVDTRKKRQAPSERSLYLSIEGTAESSSFTLETTFGDTTQCKWLL